MMEAYEARRGIAAAAALDHLRFPTLGDRFEHARDLAVRTIRWIARRQRSPLEELLGVELVVEFAARDVIVWDSRLLKKEPTVVGRWLEEVQTARKVDLRINRRTEDMIFDFWIDAGAGVTVIECDSLAWHWGQRAVDKDRRKDAWAAERGYEMFRFPSKRILEETDACVRTVVDHVLGGVR